jgi:hypothetical protein
VTPSCCTDPTEDSNVRARIGQPKPSARTLRRCSGLDISEHEARVRPFLVILGPVPQNLFVGQVAVGYDASSPAMNDPALVEKTSEFLATTARGGRALEFGIGTGRVALRTVRGSQATVRCTSRSGRSGFCCGA